jgi:hypothetical protein
MLMLARQGMVRTQPWRLRSSGTSPTPAGVVEVLREILGDAAADHHLHDGVVGHLGLLQRADIAAVAQDAHSVAQAEKFRHAVGDVDQAEAAGFEVLDQEEKGVVCGVREGCQQGEQGAEDEKRTAARAKPGVSIPGNTAA